MRTMLQLEVEVFCLTVNAFLLNQITNATDFHMNYTYNLPKYASHNVLFSKLPHDCNLDGWGKPICKCITCKKNNLYVSLKKGMEEYTITQTIRIFYIYNRKPEWLGRGYYS